MKKNKKMSVGKKVAIGAGVATIGAGVDYLLGPNSKTQQKKALALFSKMKKEAQSEIKKVKEVTVPLYNKAVDAISQNYAKQYAAHEKEIKVFAQKLKHDWKGISQKARKTVKKSIKTDSAGQTFFLENEMLILASHSNTRELFLSCWNAGVFLNLSFFTSEFR